ncbi:MULTISPECIES: TIR domain-containing protein [Paenibacillus]|uniref:TIR domain-containing protein n=1 Tax=Paenibacillus TaxID=44249 RepID=UPI0011420ECD|nr:TIR domain-containing protein [Paenibacillus sp. tmac-D7]
MKVFISYSHEDKDITNRIVRELETAGHHIWLDSWRIELGDNIFEKIKEGIDNADAIIVVISKNSLNSRGVLKEFSAMALADISRGSRRIIPVLIDKSSVPSYLSEIKYLDLSSNFEDGLKELIESLFDRVEDGFTAAASNTFTVSHDKDIKVIAKSLSDGRLTLICGAGISISAGIPAWNVLLNKLLESMMTRISNNHDISIDFSNIDDINSRYSSLIIGKYLKNNLGDDFQAKVRNALYSSDIRINDTIESIANLARPQRDRKPLDSIITFNFDSLIEEHLTNNNIKNKPIYCEGLKHNSDEIPIYHVHGYLPRSSPIPKDSNIVFSEDSYHSQFIEPFSWSNLIQLNKLNQNTCLLIGLSLTDPNLRRLLDVSSRKNSEKKINHYIIKKVPTTYRGDTEIIDRLAFLLEEQDANDLGLNVLWIHSFEEIPDILNRINIES